MVYSGVACVLEKNIYLTVIVWSGLPMNLPYYFYILQLELGFELKI